MAGGEIYLVAALAGLLPLPPASAIAISLTLAQRSALHGIAISLCLSLTMTAHVFSLFISRTVFVRTVLLTTMAAPAARGVRGAFYCWGQ